MLDLVDARRYRHEHTKDGRHYRGHPVVGGYRRAMGVARHRGAADGSWRRLVQQKCALPAQQEPVQMPISAPQALPPTLLPARRQLVLAWQQNQIRRVRYRPGAKYLRHVLPRVRWRGPLVLRVRDCVARHLNAFLLRTVLRWS